MSCKNICGLAHVGLFIKDIERSKKFYIDKLGFKIIHQAEADNPNGVTKLCFLKNGDLVIELVQFAAGPSEGDGVVDHIAIRVKNIELAYEELKHKGIEFQTADIQFLPQLFSNGCKYIYFRGPDNEHLELNQIL